MAPYRTIVLTIAGSLLISVTGCPFGNTRTSNQGGGTIITAAGKIVGGQMASLTADEIQIISDTISDLSPNVSLFIGDDEAAVAVDFLQANNLNSIEDIAAFAQAAVNNPDSVVIPESLTQFLDSGIDFGSLVSITGDTSGDTSIAPASGP